MERHEVGLCAIDTCESQSLCSKVGRASVVPSIISISPLVGQLGPSVQSSLCQHSCHNYFWEDCTDEQAKSHRYHQAYE